MERLDGPALMAISDQIIDLYRRCYSRPPWSETPEQLDEYTGKLAEATTSPGFTAVTSVDADHRLVGVSYGWPIQDLIPGNRVHDAVVSSFGAARAAELIAGAFAVAELFVHPEAQGQGIGRRLLRTLVQDQKTAWLVTATEAPAAHLYRTQGWTDQGHLPPDLYPLPLSLFTLTTPDA